MQQQAETSEHKRVVALAVDASPHSENAFDCKFLIVLSCVCVFRVFFFFLLLLLLFCFCFCFCFCFVFSLIINATENVAVGNKRYIPPHSKTGH